MALDFFRARSDRRRRSPAVLKKMDENPIEAIKGLAVGEVTSKTTVEHYTKEGARESSHDLETFTFPFHDGRFNATTQLPASPDLNKERPIPGPTTFISEARLTIRPRLPQQSALSPVTSDRIRQSIGSDLIDYFKLNAHFDAANNTTTETVQTSDRSRGLRQVTVVRKWRRVKKIGQGACGAVWLEGDDGPTEDQRAVKEIAKDIHSSTLKVNYTRELLALGRLSKHQDVFVHFYGWYDNDAAIFLAMEYFEHGDLGLYINSRLTEADTRVITRQLLEGLVILHAQNWAHRDLKPENIFVVRHSPNWWVKIGDFGISKRIREDETMTAIGTLKYIAPEILGYVEEDENDCNESTRSNVAVDMWSLGCVLYQLLTLELPFANQRKLASHCRSGKVFPGERLEACMVSNDAIECVRKLLVPQPSVRLSAFAALQCSWVNIVEIENDVGLEQNELSGLTRLQSSLLTQEDWPLKRQSIEGHEHTERLIQHDKMEKDVREESTMEESIKEESAQETNGKRHDDARHDDARHDDARHDDVWHTDARHDDVWHTDQKLDENGQVTMGRDGKQEDLKYLDELQFDNGLYFCRACGKVLKDGKAFELGSNHWHIDCFRCETCGTLLDSDANLLLLNDGTLICNNCTYSCSACGNKIEDLAILTGDQAFCATCFRCRYCKEKIENLRYARTSQGIFCMQCHEALMERRRRKSMKKAKKLLDPQKSSSSNDTIPGVISSPSLPDIVPQTFTVPDQDLNEHPAGLDHDIHRSPSPTTDLCLPPNARN